MRKEPSEAYLAFKREREQIGIPPKRKTKAEKQKEEEEIAALRKRLGMGKSPKSDRILKQERTAPGKAARRAPRASRSEDARRWSNLRTTDGENSEVKTYNIKDGNDA